MAISREEIFGPVQCIMRYESLEEVWNWCGGHGLVDVRLDGEGGQCEVYDSIWRAGW